MGKAWKTVIKFNRINNTESLYLNLSQISDLQINCKNGEDRFVTNFCH